MLMTVQVIPVRTTGPVKTEWTDSTAAAHQDLMENYVKQVTIAKISSISLMVDSRQQNTMVKKIW